MGEPIRLGVIGAGRMGRYHIQKFSSMPSVHFVGFYDPANSHGFSSLEELLYEVDAVVVASPTSSHFRSVLAALNAGVHVLVEKPFCADLKLATELVDSAESKGLVLQVGFVERHRLGAILPPVPIHSMVYAYFHRHANQRGREKGICVVWDLMIHDLDIVLSNQMGELEVVFAEGGIVHSEGLDYARCRLRFEENGVEREFVASRVGGESSRMMFGQTQSESFQVDFMRPSGDPLALQAAHFIQSVVRRECGTFSGRAGLRVLRVVEAIRSEILNKTELVQTSELVR